MIIDCIHYNGEEDMFDLRYNILKDYVDQFIVVEANETFSGNPKQLYFPKIKDKYEKVKYCVNDGLYRLEEVVFAAQSPSTGGNIVWMREFLQKEAIAKALVHLNDEDIVFISDCDEIWNPTVLPKIGEEVYKLSQLVYCYYLNNRSNEPWAGTFVAKYKNIKGKTLNYLRATVAEWLTKPWTFKNVIQDGGWHFTHQGGVEEIKRKIESYGHQELNTIDFKNSLENKIKENKDFLGQGRDYKLWRDESNWPEYLIENRQKYLNMLTYERMHML